MQVPSQIPHSKRGELQNYFIQGDLDMKKLFLLGVSTFALLLSIAQGQAMPQKAKIVIFTSTGGCGHQSACDTLKNALPEHTIKLVAPIRDFFSKKSNGSFTGEKWYDSLVQSGWIRFANFIVQCPGVAFLKMHMKHFEQTFYQFLQQEKPDLLISVIPLVNYPAARAAYRCNIPFLLITLDANLYLWLTNLERFKGKFADNATITINCQTPLITSQLKKKKIPLTAVKEIGSPLRNDFFVPKNKKSICSEWNLPTDKPIVMLIRGGMGSNSLLSYVKELQSIDIPLHILACIGKNTKLIPRLNAYKLPQHISLSIIPFTTKISDLMAVSNIMITQPSPNVCNEALHYGIPLLIDRTGPSLFWERATIDWIKQRGNGAVFTRLKDLRPLIKRYIALKTSEQIPQEQLFKKNIRTIVAEILQKAAQSKIKTSDGNVIQPA